MPLIDPEIRIVALTNRLNTVEKRLGEMSEWCGRCQLAGKVAESLKIQFPPVTSDEKRLLAIELRKQGMSYGKIAHILHNSERNIRRWFPVGA